jgi:hypothetical protein
MGQIRQGESPGPRGQPFIGDYTYDCVKYMGGANNHLIRFNQRRYGSAPGFDMYKELGWGTKGPITRYITGKIKNWSERSKLPGKETIDLPARLCGFYITGPEDKPRMHHSIYCQSVKFDVVWTGGFGLVPNISVGTQDIVDGGDQTITNITSRVRNDGPGESELSRGIVSRFVVKKTDRNDTIDRRLGQGGDSISNNHTTAAQEYVVQRFKGRDYRRLANPNPQKFKIGTVTLLHNGSETIDVPLEVGDRVCYITSVQRPTQNHTNSNWRHSVPACVAIGARPHLQVRSGDVMVGNKIITSITNRTADGTKRTYGSWGEYGAIAGNSISNFGSGAVYRMGMPDNRRNLGFLSFANTPNHGNYGTVNDGSNTLAQFFSKMPAQGKKVAGAAPTLDLSSLTGHHVIRPEADIKLQGSLQSGTSVIILMKAGKTAQVTGNIQTPDRYSSTGDISQLVIAPAGDNSNFNIHVAAAATRVDAWMIAPAGRIDTCNNSLTLGSREAPRRGNGCENSLFVNGPVAAKAFLLGRTGGRDKASDGPATQSLPAENFNLRQDAYLWIANQVNSSGARYITTQSVDLPPRY